MRVYSWKTLIATILIGGGAFIYQVKKFIQGDKISFFYVLFLAYLLIKGLWVSFSKEGFQHDMRNETIKIRVLRAQFGKWAPLVSFGGYILLILAVILAIFLPSLQFLSLALYFGGLIFMIIMGLYVRKHVKEEKKKFF